MALDAIRHAIAVAPGHPAVQRVQVRQFLMSLDGPAQARPGLLGPFWFDANRARQQAIRVRRFRAQRCESAPLQIVSVGPRHPPTTLRAARSSS
jgi:hypothetical protein